MKSFSKFFLIAVSFSICLSSPGQLRADESQYLLTPPSVAAIPGQMQGRAPSQRPSQQHPIRTLASSLAIVLGVFLLLMLVLRKKDPAQAEHNERNALQLMQNLGELSVTSSVKLNLVRVGSRLLVLHVGDKSVQTVAEISDPDEVATLLGNEAEDFPQPESRVSDLLARIEDQGRFVEVA